MCFPPVSPILLLSPRLSSLPIFCLLLPYVLWLALLPLARYRQATSSVSWLCGLQCWSVGQSTALGRTTTNTLTLPRWYIVLTLVMCCSPTLRFMTKYLLNLWHSHQHFWKLFWSPILQIKKRRNKKYSILVVSNQGFILPDFEISVWGSCPHSNTIQVNGIKFLMPTVLRKC